MRILVLLLLIFAGCAKDGTSDNPIFCNCMPNKPMPEKITVDASQLKPIGDQEFEATKKFMAAMKMVNLLREHILIPSTESDESRRQREQDYAKLTSKQKAAVKEIDAQCKVTDDPPKQIHPQTGTTINLSEYLRTTGKACKADLSRESHTRYVVTKDGAQQGTGEMSIEAHERFHTEYKDKDLAQIAMLKSMEIEWAVHGWEKIEKNSSAAYAEIDGSGYFELLVPGGEGRADVRLRGEYLVHNDSDRDLAMYADVTVAGEVHQFAVHALERHGVREVTEFYIGNRALTAHERKQLAVDDFVRRLSE
jgi:hypothetical protein